MSRAERLLDLIQILRRHRFPVSGEKLSGELGISLRTLYRDIASLQHQGATIEGAPGIGYQLRQGFTLPPLMFREDELEALALGTRWVAERADGALSLAARNALAKIAAVLPAQLREELDASALLVGPGDAIAAGHVDLADIRRAIRREQKLTIAYRDDKGRESERTIWPFALAFFDRVRIVAAWCELRQDYRHFRADRMVAVADTGQRYPRRRLVLLGEWRTSIGLPPGEKTTDRN